MDEINQYTLLRQLLETCERLWVENLAMKAILERAPGFSWSTLEALVGDAEFRSNVHARFEPIYAALGEKQDQELYAALSAMMPKGKPN